jgi:hypothetical protein
MASDRQRGQKTPVTNFRFAFLGPAGRGVNTPSNWVHPLRAFILCSLECILPL